MEPVHAACTDSELIVTLAGGQKIVTPLYEATPAQRARSELSPFGVHWPDLDEDLSVEGMRLGSKAPGAKEPAPA